MIRRAAEATDTTITDFILGSVLESAERVLADRMVHRRRGTVGRIPRLLDAPLPADAEARPARAARSLFDE